MPPMPDVLPFAPTGIWPRVLVCAVLGTMIGACGPRETRFEIVDYRDAAGPVTYHQAFDECYYNLSADGRVNLVARRTGRLETDPDQTVTQVVHIRGIWRAVPGTTHVERSQINAKISYWIVGGPGGVGFEGGGFVVFSENHERDVLTGQLESSALRPKRRVGTAPDIFQRAELTGEFRAKRNRRRAVRILNEMRRRFGPLPRHDAPPPPL